MTQSWQHIINASGIADVIRRAVRVRIQNRPKLVERLTGISYQVCPMQNFPVGRWLWTYRAWYHHRSEQSAASRVTTQAHCGPVPRAGNHAIVNHRANTASGVNLNKTTLSRLNITFMPTFCRELLFHTCQVANLAPLNSLNW